MEIRKFLFSTFLVFFWCFVGHESRASLVSTKKGRFELVMSEFAGSQEMEFIDFRLKGYESGVRTPSFLFLETESVRSVVGELTLGGKTKYFVAFAEPDKAPVIWMRLKSTEELNEISDILSKSPWSNGQFNLPVEGQDHNQLQVAEKSLPPTEGELYAKLDFGDSVLGTGLKGWSLPGFRTALRGWDALGFLLSEAQAPFKVVFLMSSVLSERLTRGLDLDTNQRFQFKKFFPRGESPPMDFDFYGEAANGGFHGISDTSYLVERKNAQLSEHEKRASIQSNDRPLFEIFYVAFHLPGNQKNPVLGFFRVYPAALDLHLILDESNRLDATEIANEFGWLANYSIEKNGKVTSPGMEGAMADVFPPRFYVLGFSFPLHRTDRHQLITVERAAADIMTVVLQKHRGVLVDPRALEALRKGSLSDYEAYVQERLRIEGSVEKGKAADQDLGKHWSCRSQLVTVEKKGI